jgi:DNA-binding beta-propeller fold protein YncE
VSKTESFSLLVLVFLASLAFISCLVVICNFAAKASNNTSSSNVTIQTNASFVNKWGSSCLLSTHYGCSDPDGPSGPLSLGDGQFSSIWGIAADLGKVYVIDVSNNRIQVFSNNGTFIKTWGSFCDITTGNKCSDPDGPSGPLSLGDGQFNYPQGISTDSTGNVYVADSGNNRIQVFSNNGTFIKRWGSIGSGPGEFRHPEGIAVDTSRNNSNSNILYVADSGNNRIQVLFDNGTFIKTWGSFCQIRPDRTPSEMCSDPDGSQGPMKVGEGQFSHPTSLAIDSGYVFVADNLNDRVQVFSSLAISPQPLTGINKTGTNVATVSTNVSSNNTAALANNAAPVASDQTITTNVNTPKTITLSATDANSDNLTASITKPPTNGRLSSINQDTGEVTYTPASGYTGTDSFQFKVTDDKGADSNVATVTIIVT